VVNTVVDEVLPAGAHAVVWDGKNEQGKDVASGVYFYRIKAGDFESTQKMTLLR
jgi:flagellar hook assembly protein FlgD